MVLLYLFVPWRSKHTSLDCLFAQVWRAAQNTKKLASTQMCKSNLSSSLECKIQIKACYNQESISRAQIHQACRNFRSSMVLLYKKTSTVQLAHVFVWAGKQICRFVLLPVPATYQYFQSHLLKGYHKIYAGKDRLAKISFPHLLSVWPRLVFFHGKRSYDNDHPKPAGRFPLHRFIFQCVQNWTWPQLINNVSIRNTFSCRRKISLSN